MRIILEENEAQVFISTLILFNEDYLNIVLVSCIPDKSNCSISRDMKQTATLEISTVDACPNACDYCPQRKLVKAYRGNNANNASRMSLNTFKTCIDKMPRNTWIDFSAFVEPFLSDNCADMIVYANKNDHPIRIFTTIVGMRKEDIEKIECIDLMRFTLHLPDNHGVMKVRVDDYYCEVFDYLLKQWPSIEAMCFGQIHEKLGLIAKRNHTKVNIKGLTNEHLGTRANNTDNTKFINLNKYPRKQGKLYCKPIFQKNGGPHGRFNHNVLLPNGDVVLCCSDYGLKHNLGSLLSDSYEDLFLSSEYKKVICGLEDESIDILCRTCEHAMIIDSPVSI